MVKILFIEDDIKTQKVVKAILPEDYILISSTLGRHGLSLLKKENPDVVLLDIGLPDIDGFKVLEKILEIPASPPVIILTSCEKIHRVVRAVKMGAADYITKPYKSAELLQAIRSSLREQHAADKNSNSGEKAEPVLKGIIGTSPAMEYIRSMIPRYAGRVSPVLITGESGTGKDLAARMLHDTSPRRKNPFIALNCSALPHTLIETELFGSEEGAFTGAVSRSGHIEQAEGGTLFLDEIGDMALQAQSKLLRFIEEKTITHVGGVHTIDVDVRILAATNKPLTQMVREKLFREDLYYRLRVLTIHIPPLRERKEDIPPLVDYILEHLPGTHPGITDEALEKLLAHQWPGNVRELKSVLERAVVHADSRLIERRHIIF